MSCLLVQETHDGTLDVRQTWPFSIRYALLFGLKCLKFLSIKFPELLNHILVGGLGHKDNLESFLLQSLDEGRGSDHILGVAGDVVDALLVLLHHRHVIFE